MAEQAVQLGLKGLLASRCPDAHPAGAPGAHYGPEDAQDALADADRVISEARSAWRQLGEAADEAADPDAGSWP